MWGYNFSEISFFIPLSNRIVPASVIRTITGSDKMENEMWLSDKQLEARGLGSRRTIWRRANQGKFPAPIKLSEGMTRWRLSDVLAYENDPLGYCTGREAKSAQEKVIKGTFKASVPA